MTKTDSFYDAVKRLPELTGLPPRRVEKIYRQLQDNGDDGWLPKSSGRQILAATRPMMAILLIGLASGGETPRAACETFVHATKDGKRRGDGFAKRLEQILENESEIADIEEIEFRPDLEDVLIKFDDGQIERYADESGLPSRTIVTRSVIKGQALKDIATKINFAKDGETFVDLSAGEKK